MKRLTTKILTIAACAAMMLTAAPLANTQSVQAAVKAQGTVDLTTQKLSIPKGVKTAMANKTVTMVKARRYQVKAKFGTTVVKSNATWKSSKPAVATVSTTGLITAKAPGTATIKVTYGKKSQTFKVKVIASHTHSWKTLSKSTCATKGKKLCKTCGATGTTSLSKTHSFEVTKKATCKTKGVQTCSVCGAKETIAKTSHNWKTATWETVEGRGKGYDVVSTYCGGCNIDMTDWTKEEVIAHTTDLNNFQCFGANIYGSVGETRYPQYFMVKKTEIRCKHCGAWKDKFQEDLYECDRYGNKIETGSDVVTSKKAAARAVASPQDVITDVPDNNESFDVTDVIVSDNAAISEDTVSEDIISGNEVISGNAVSEDSVSENSISGNETVIDGETVTDNSELNTDITDPNQGGDSVFNDSADDGIVIENREDNDGIIIETVEDTEDDIIIEDIDDTDNSDDGTDDYDGSEGEVVEDE